MKKISRAIWAARYWLAFALMGVGKKQYMDMVQKAMTVDLASFANPSFEESIKRCADGLGADLTMLETLEYVFSGE